MAESSSLELFKKQVNVDSAMCFSGHAGIRSEVGLVLGGLSNLSNSRILPVSVQCHLAWVEVH